MEISTLRHKLEQRKGERNKTRAILAGLKRDLKTERRRAKNLQKAREIVRQVGMKTQQQLSFHISNITTLALESVFEDPYKLNVNFVEKRNKTECDLLFERNNSEITPISASGVGAVDVAAFSLRIASWSMVNPKPRNVLLLDEPFKHLKGYDENLKVIEMVKQLSEKLGLQIIMVHDERVPFEDIEKGADNVFKVSMEKGKSIVK